MSAARSFINPQAQSYESLKAGTPMSANQRVKFDVLNAHIANSVVVGGELVIVGDPSTPMCTAHEAFLMAKAAGIHHQLEINGAGVDDFLLDNYDLLKSLLAHSSLGAGAAADGWSKYLEAIKETLEEIEQLHRKYLGGGVKRSLDEFYAKRMALFMKLDEQLGNIAAYGSSLRNRGAAKRALEISTKSYLHTGEIAGYSEKIAGVSRAAAWVRQGTYIGVGLDVASTALDIHKACTVGRENECTKAKYVHGGSLVMGLGGGSVGGSVGSFLATAGCTFVLGVTTGVGALACAVVGGAAGGVVGGSIGAEGGEAIGEYLYRKVAE